MIWILTDERQITTGHRGINFTTAHNSFHSGVEMETQQQQFCLKWNSFGTNLATSFGNLFKSENLADVTLFCDGVTFRAHKLILAACSKHLADLFETAPAMLHQNLLVILDGTSASNMSALLEFMYKGEVHVSQDALSSFLKAAESLQVKGLSIEHEKLAVAQGHPNMDTTLDSTIPRKRLNISKEEMESSNNHQQQQPQSSPSPSYSPAMSPYMQPPNHYRQYDQKIPSSGSAFDNLNNKRSQRSPPIEQALQDRASVLRDGSKSGRPGSPGPLSLAYRPSPTSSCPFPNQPNQEADAPPENRFDPDQATALICPESESANVCQDPGCPEDLRMRMDPTIKLEREEPASSTGGNGNGKCGNNSVSSNSANGSLGTMASYAHELDKNDLIHPSLWNTVAAKVNKAGSVNTPDGKKLKCPFCERLYGYETNLRAHIRQRHQGIRVPCPYCSRTFTRNNTVRRHIAREHKVESNLKGYPNQTHLQQQQQVHNHVP